MTKRIAVFPGSFSPFTRGHESVVLRGLSLFDEIIVSLGVNSSKKDYFTAEERLNWINQIFKNYEKVKAMSYEGLTVNHCQNVGANYILRGLRNVQDFEYEMGIAQMNFSLMSKIETVFIITEPKFSHISSTLVRDVMKNGGNVNQFLPEGISIDNR
ncbi:MAG: pantetheine-phosphate adenylyltransferase [Bacteroidota bacterium]|nr:pantetheine-phosphate adenylyltransferase [Bacteroidota bacterium]